MATEAKEGQDLTQTLVWLGGMFAVLALIAYFWV